MNEQYTQYDHVRAIEWIDGHLMLLDQRLLPKRKEYIKYDKAADVAWAIRDMVVRGAPAIGITAAYAVVMSARRNQSKDDGMARLREDMDLLASSRPTAVNLFWALERMGRVIERKPEDLVRALELEALAIHREDIASNRAMGDFGAELIGEKSSVLTHCNTGSLATGGYGTALGVIRSAYTQGRIRSVYADETRPWLQGSRLTAWELKEDKIPVNLICEGAAASLMRMGAVNWVIVGADRITANGDVANKIGTYSLAVLAKHHGVKMMVVAPTSSIDMKLESGDMIPIEERSAEEVLTLFGKQIAPSDVGVWNPAFDVTPAGLIDALVTERGVVLSPDKDKMKALMEG